MKIGIAAPLSTDSVIDLIEGDTSSLPAGTYGAPFLGTLIKALIKQGHQVSAYTLDDKLPPGQLQPIIAGGENFKIYYGPCRKHSVRFNEKYIGRTLDFFYREVKALKIAIELDQPDIVHGHWSYEYAFAAIGSKKPHVVTCHDSPFQVLKFMPNYYRFGRLLMALYVYRKAHYLTAVSPYLEGELAKFAKTRILIVPNPTPRTPNTTKFDQIYDSVHPKIVMISNGWENRKNAKPALLAFNALLKTRPGATLHIFGCDFEADGPAYQWAKSNHIEQNIVFNGAVKSADLLNFLDSATLLLHPALEECCPLSLIEAMSSGLPVVAGENSGGVPWILDYGKAGMLADITSPASMAEKMNQLLDDRALFESIQKNGAERVSQLFTQEAVAAAYVNIYRQAIAGSY